MNFGHTLSHIYLFIIYLFIYFIWDYWGQLAGPTHWSKLYFLESPIKQRRICDLMFTINIHWFEICPSTQSQADVKDQWIGCHPFTSWTSCDMAKNWYIEWIPWYLNMRLVSWSWGNDSYLSCLFLFGLSAIVSQQHQLVQFNGLNDLTLCDIASRSCEGVRLAIRKLGDTSL